MGIHVVIQPLAGYGAEVVSPSPGVRHLVAGGEGTTVLVQCARPHRRLVGHGAIRAEMKPAARLSTEQEDKKVAVMGAPKYARFSVGFDEWYPQGLYLVGEITPVTEYQSQKPFRPVVLEGLDSAVAGGTSGQAKWITWTIRATAMRTPGVASASATTAAKPTSGKSAVDTLRRAAA